MSTVSLIQIGDIHLSQFKSERFVDYKDDGIPDELISHLAIPKLQVVIRAITRLQTSLHYPCLLFCGDLSSYGSIDEYKECVELLVDVLDLGARQPEMIHVVPGNHDVNRTLCTDKTTLNLKSKFLPLTNAWTSVGLDVLTVESVRTSTITDTIGDIKVYSLNSCIGCGEWRAMPTRIRNAFGKVIEDFAAGVTESEAFALAGEQLDTPMFLFDDVDKLNTDLAALPTNVLPLVLSHHNILPQALQRVDLYTELINSGPFRTTLTQHQRPIIYCHGHIHADPIESVSDATRPLSQVIAVSAPALVDGFNVLHVHFAHNRVPIGLVVDFHRLQPNGNVTKTNSHRITLCPQSTVVLTDPDMDSMSVILKRNGEWRSEQFKEAFNEHRQVSANRNTMARLFIEAEWKGLLVIADRDGPFDRWIIRRTYQ